MFEPDATDAEVRAANLPARPISRDLVVLASPTWSLRVEGRRLAIVLSRAPLPHGAELSDLVVELPHVSFPFDFRDGLDRFRHHRGFAEELTLKIEARLLLDWLNHKSGGAIHGTAYDDQLVLSGRIDSGTRWTMRARIVPASTEDLEGEGEPLLQLSLHGMRVYGPSTDPWPRFAERVLDLLPRELVVDRTLTTARLRCVRSALAWVLSELGWKLPDVSRLEARGVELREGRFVARFAAPHRERDARDFGETRDLIVDSDGSWAVRTAFERFVEDLELKRHHGQVDRLLETGQIREALAEVYRALEGPPRPGFLAERLIGITATQPILHDEGERICRGLLELSPGYEPALVGLAAIALGRQRPEEAAVQLERLLGVLTAPHDREDATAADLTLATILRDFAPDESRAALERVLVRSPDHEEALAELIALTESEGDARLALPLYKRLLFSARSKARTRDAGLRLARFALSRNEPEDARVLLKVVLESTPDDLEAQVALAEVETRDGRALEALRILEDALRRIPPSDAVRLVKVIVLLSRLLLDVVADPARARRVLWRAGDISRLDGGDALELATLAMKAREPALALRFCELVSYDAPDWPDAQAIRAEALVARHESRQALQALLAVLSREPDHARALSLLEVAAPEAAQREWLVHQLYDSAARVPSGESRAKILHRVARLYESLGLSWDAIAPLEEAVMDAPGSEGFEPRAARLMELQQEFGLWTEYLRTGAKRLVRMRAEGLVDEAAIGKRVALLTAMGRAALDEVGDATHARSLLEEASRLSPRSIEAQEFLARALEAELRDAALETSRPIVQGLVAVLTRLIALRSESMASDDARLRLAELQLDWLNAPGPARATLAKLGEARHSERGQRLLVRVGLAAAPEPRAPKVEQRPTSSRSVPLSDRWNAALAAADRGDDTLARSLLEAILAEDPGHVPARELRLLLEPGALAEEVRPEAPSMSAVVEYDKFDAVDSVTSDVAPASYEIESDTNALRGILESAIKPAVIDIEAASGKPLAEYQIQKKSPVGVIEKDSPNPPADNPVDPEIRPPPVISTAALAQVDARIHESDEIETLLGDATTAFFEDDIARARKALEAIFEIDPDVVAALELYQEILQAQGEHARRADILERLVDRVFDASSSAGYLKALGESASLAGESSRSLQAFQRYLRLRPLDEAVFKTTVEALGRLDGREDAARLAEIWEARADALEDAESSAGAIIRALFSAARAQFRAEAFPAAAYACERADALSGSNPDPEILDLWLRADLATGGATAMKRVRQTAARLAPLLLDGPERQWVEGLTRSPS
jgi:tetratricopeptide (TPR) repeat protein